MDCIRHLGIRLTKDVFVVGDQINGEVVLETTENLRVRGVRAVLRGRAHAEWRIMRSGERRTIKEDQLFLENKLVVWGKDRHEEGAFPILPAGLHRFPITFSLTNEQALPCSFESKMGTIRYFIRVIVDMPYASSPHCIKYFTVISPSIDCMDEMYQTPVIGEDKKNDWSWCCLRGSYGLRIVLDRSAYMCGEAIGMKIQIDNQSDRECWVRIRLTQYVEYFINKGVLGVTKTVSYVVAEHLTPRVMPRTRQRFDTSLEQSFRLPVVPPTLIGICPLLQVYYQLTVSLETSNTAKRRLKIDLPFTVATVPPADALKGRSALAYAPCSSHVEGGMYVSPEFQLGQVYDGSATEEQSNCLLYRPLYACLLSSGNSTVEKESIDQGYGGASNRDNTSTKPSSIRTTVTIHACDDSAAQAH